MGVDDGNLGRTLVELIAGDYRLALDPGLGGSIASFTWRSLPLMRATHGASILATACFPLVPFSNRIAHGRFSAGGAEVRLTPNFPGSDHPHPLHGFGWLAAWRVVETTATTAVLVHDHETGEWPWSYTATQRLALLPSGLRHELSCTNRSPRPMPAGLGLHPYFPRTDATQLRAQHRGEWMVDAEGLPQRLIESAQPRDWWDGRPVSARVVDTVFADRAGDIAIDWPERRLRLHISPSATLPHTVIYAPADADFFCVEPVSHATDAINRDGGRAMRWLDQGEEISVSVTYRAEPLVT